MKYHAMSTNPKNAGGGVFVYEKLININHINYIMDVYFGLSSTLVIYKNNEGNYDQEELPAINITGKTDDELIEKLKLYITFS